VSYIYSTIERHPNLTGKHILQAKVTHEKDK